MHVQMVIQMFPSNKIERAVGATVLRQRPRAQLPIHLPEILPCILILNHEGFIFFFTPSRPLFQTHVAQSLNLQVVQITYDETVISGISEMYPYMKHNYSKMSYQNNILELN